MIMNDIVGSRGGLFLEKKIPAKAVKSLAYFLSSG